MTPWVSNFDQFKILFANTFQVNKIADRVGMTIEESSPLII